MDDVKIHYNSAKPSQIQALAYTQSNNVYLGAGQEKHLGHELWHVVQQKQGRVVPTTQVNGLPVNDNAALEREADRYGRNAAPLMTENLPKILSASPASVGNTLQCFTENEVSYNTVGEYYQFLCNTERTTIQNRRIDVLDRLTAAFSEDFIFKINISTCNSWPDVGKTIKDNLSQNQEELLSAVFALYKGSMYPNMDLTKPNTQTQIFAGSFNLISQFLPNFSLFKPMFHHENLDRARDPGSSEPIDPYDISDEFVPGKSCVITALFHAESERIREEFHAERVEEFHNVLVSAFKHNKYTDITDDTEVTEHQKNNVWRNYSDDSVYPGLYAYFGYIPHNDCQNVYLGTAINDRMLPPKKGMICLDEHMLYFDNTKNPPSFFDNDNGPNAPSPANKTEKIKCIYYKS